MKCIFFILILLCIAGCSSNPSIIRKTTISVPEAQEIYIVDHGLHTGFVIHAPIIQSHLPELAVRFTNTPYLEFGWGDKNFYQADEATAGLALRAIFWPTESVVHVVALSERPDMRYSASDVVTLCLEPGQYALLVEFIINSFFKDNIGQIKSLKYGIYGDSQFYKGEGTYYLLNTCNNWTAKGLRSAGIKIDPTFKLTADSIMKFLSDNEMDLPWGSCNSIRERNIIYPAQ